MTAIYNCDQCGQTPCLTRTLCRRFRQMERDLAAAARQRSYERPEPEQPPPPAQSTIDAYRYVKGLGDEAALKGWIDRHPGFVEPAP